MLSDREGVAALAMLAMYADDHIAPEEDAMLRARLCQFPLFEDIPDADLGHILATIEKRIRAQGADRTIGEAASVVQPHLRATAFLLASEIVAADGHVALQESTYLARLKKELHVDDRTADRIFEVTQLRLRR